MEDFKAIKIINVSSQEFEEALRRIIREELGATIDNKPPDDVEKFYTRQQTSGRLKISLPTLNEYTKRGIIEASRVGSRVLYSEESIRKSLNKISHKKNNNELNQPKTA
jgi:RNase P/RNase MRP subunit POP5